jgi:hypothetical protein
MNKLVFLASAQMFAVLLMAAPENLVFSHKQQEGFKQSNININIIAIATTIDNVTRG